LNPWSRRTRAARPSTSPGACLGRKYLLTLTTI
jgi:hypothetical protein